MYFPYVHGVNPSQLKSHVFSKFHPFCLEIHPHPVSLHPGSPICRRSELLEELTAAQVENTQLRQLVKRRWDVSVDGMTLPMSEITHGFAGKGMKNPWKTDEITGIARVVSKFRSPSNRVPIGLGWTAREMVNLRGSNVRFTGSLKC
jgi:hypothetical protein